MPLKSSGPRRKLLAVASGGGHWVQLLRLTPAFVRFDVVFVTVDDVYRAEVPGHKFYTVNDATRWDKIGLAFQAFRIAWILWKERPDAVISTGAAPGYFALRLGRLVGARTIWVDSIANAERLSMSGEKALRCADLCLTQWPHLALPAGPYYAGDVL